MKKLTVPENIYLEKFDVNVKPYLSYAEIQAISKAVNNFDSWAEMFSSINTMNNKPNKNILHITKHFK